jgi:NADH:ubiquinone oxidoreductase subunit 4 (subunit M)
MASVLLIFAILSIGLAPFWLINIISPDTQIIMENIARGAIGN